MDPVEPVESFEASATIPSRSSLTLPLDDRAAWPRSQSKLSWDNVIDIAFFIFIRYTVDVLDGKSRTPVDDA